MADTQNTTRRGFLAAMGLGAAALAVPVGAEAASAGDSAPLDRMREEYLRKLERLAEELKPRFVSGELHGFNRQDGEAEDEARRRGVKKHTAPIWQFEAELEKAQVPTFEAAYMILACSPSEGLLSGDIVLAEARGAAAQCMTNDLIRIARRRGWYVPHESEEPSNAELGLAA